MRGCFCRSQNLIFGFGFPFPAVPDDMQHDTATLTVMNNALFHNM